MSHDAFISSSDRADDRLALALGDGLRRLARPWYRRHALQVVTGDDGLAEDGQAYRMARHYTQVDVLIVLTDFEPGEGPEKDAGAEAE